MWVARIEDQNYTVDMRLLDWYQKYYARESRVLHTMATGKQLHWLQLASGADTNAAEGRHGETALPVASKRGHKNVTSLLWTMKPTTVSRRPHHRSILYWNYNGSQIDPYRAGDSISGRS
jgi:hypothetical protein